MGDLKIFRFDFIVVENANVATEEKIRGLEGVD